MVMVPVASTVVDAHAGATVALQVLNKAKAVLVALAIVDLFHYFEDEFLNVRHFVQRLEQLQEEREFNMTADPTEDLVSGNDGYNFNTNLRTRLLRLSGDSPRQWNRSWRHCFFLSTSLKQIKAGFHESFLFPLKLGVYEKLYALSFTNELHHFQTKALVLNDPLIQVKDITLLCPLFAFAAWYFQSALYLEIWAYGVFAVINHCQCHMHSDHKHPVFVFLHNYCNILIKDSEQHAHHHDKGNEGWSVATVGLIDLLLDAFGGCIKRLLNLEAAYPGKQSFSRYQDFWDDETRAIYEAQKRGDVTSKEDREKGACSYQGQLEKIHRRDQVPRRVGRNTQWWNYGCSY